MKTGIDAISFYTPRYFLDLKTLAAARNVDPDKYYKGIGQRRMSVPPPDEDIVTMGACAAHYLLERETDREVDLLLLATESGVDQSKAAALFVHGLLGLPTHCRAVELKQACYSGTAALRMAAAMIASGASRRAMVIASDVARYELESPGESTQGAGAVAMLITANPRLIELDSESGCYADDVMDFWRPNYREEALVDGKYSTLVYIQALLESWNQYAAASGRTVDDFDRFCYHIPFTRMAEKAHSQLLKKNGGGKPDPERMARDLEAGLEYSREAGNCYAGSMYVGLASMLDLDAEDLGGKRIGFFSYGSGCMGEFFSGRAVPGYRAHLMKEHHADILSGRTELTYQQYEDIYHLESPTDGGEHTFAQYRTGPYRLAGISRHKRIYEAVS